MTVQQEDIMKSNLFHNDFLNNLIEFTEDKFFIIGKENDRNYWSGTVNQKWSTNNFQRVFTSLVDYLVVKEKTWDGMFLSLKNTSNKY